MKFTYQDSAYADMKYSRLCDILDGKQRPMLSDLDGSIYFECEGYVRIGTATVEVEVLEEKEIVGKQVASLRKQLSAVRAENQRRENAILDRISKLQAIELTPALPT